MIELKRGDLLSSDVDAIVNTVNCVGVMGKGVALQFKKAYPENFKIYKKLCDKGLIKIGEMFVFNTGRVVGPKFIINFPTKIHWKSPSKIEYISDGLDSLISTIKELRIQSIALPPLGCGNGGLSWNLVLPLIRSRLAELSDTKILLYEPVGAPETKQESILTKSPSMTIFNATFLKLIDRYLYWEDTLSRLEIQKLCYFQRESGDPMFKKLRFEAKEFGPYSIALSHLIHDMDGHYLNNCGDNNDPWRQISLNTEESNKIIKTLDEQMQTIKFISRVNKLIDGFETPFGMELLSSVHWVAHYCQYKATNLDSAIMEVHDWNLHKKNLFKPDHIKIAWERLINQGWITV